MMGTLIHRPLVDINFKVKYPILVDMVNDELDLVKKVFDRQLAQAQTPSGPIIHKNMPKVAGLLRWSNELRERSQSAVTKLRALNHG